MNPDITKMSTNDLKALWYDQYVLFDSYKSNLNIINTELASRLKVEQDKNKEVTTQHNG